MHIAHRRRYAGRDSGLLRRNDRQYNNALHGRFAVHSHNTFEHINRCGAWFRLAERYDSNRRIEHTGLLPHSQGEHTLPQGSGVGNDKLFNKFANIIGHQELLEDERYKDNVSRCDNYIPDLQNLIREWCADYTKSEIEDIMDEAGIPCGPVLNVKEAIEHPHIQARDMMVHCEHPTVGDMYFQGCVIKLSETPGEVETAPPLVGQHNREVFGLSEEEEKALIEEGVL